MKIFVAALYVEIIRYIAILAVETPLLQHLLQQLISGFFAIKQLPQFNHFVRLI
jgi:hypothetical protein